MLLSNTIMSHQDSLFPSVFAAYLWRWSSKWHSGPVPDSPDVLAASGRRWGSLWLQRCWDSKWIREHSYGRWASYQIPEAPYLRDCRRSSRHPLFSVKNRKFALILFVITITDEGWQSLRVFRCVETCVSHSRIAQHILFMLRCTEIAHL